MPSLKPVVRASVLVGFDQLLAEQGSGVEDLYIRSGLPPPSDIEPEGDLPIDAVTRLMEAAAVKFSDPCIGLSWAESFPVGGTGLFYYLFANERNVGQGLHVLARYAVLLRQPFQVHFDEDADGGLLWWRWPSSLTGSTTQYGSFALGLTVLRIKRVLGPNWFPVFAELQGDQLRCLQKVKSIFGKNVLFNSDRNAIRLDLEALQRPMPHADTRLQPILRQLGEQMIAELPAAGDISACTRDAILDLLPEGRATLDQVAECLGISPRTLQSRLAQKDTTFEQLLNATLKLRAEFLIRSTDFSMTDIAMLLGFSELSAFTRAAKTWFKMPPSAYRQKIKSTSGI